MLRLYADFLIIVTEVHTYLWKKSPKTAGSVYKKEKRCILIVIDIFIHLPHLHHVSRPKYFRHTYSYRTNSYGMFMSYIYYMSYKRWIGTGCDIQLITASRWDSVNSVWLTYLIITTRTDRQKARCKDTVCTHSAHFSVCIYLVCSWVHAEARGQLQRRWATSDWRRYGENTEDGWTHNILVA